MRYLLIDTETTGLPKSGLFLKFGEQPNPKNLEAYDSARVVQIAVIVYNSDTGRTTEQVKYVKCDFHIPNSDFHGVTDEICAERGESFTNIALWFSQLLDHTDCIVAYNINFDIAVMASEFYRLGNSKLVEKMCSKKQKCAMEHAKNVMRSRKYPKLSDFYYFTTRKNIVKAHDALFDIKATQEAIWLSGFYGELYN